MKKIYDSCKGVAARLLALALLGGAAISAQAADLGAIEAGKTYSSTSLYDEVLATFTAPKSGKVSVTTTGIQMRTYTDASHATEVNASWASYYGTVNYSYQAEEGTTYYMYVSSANNWQAFDFTVYMEGVGQTQPLEIQYISPAAGKTFDLANEDEVIVQFNQNVKAGVAAWYGGPEQGKLRSGGKINVYGSKLVFNAGNMVRSVASSPSYGPGTEFFIALRNVTSEEGEACVDAVEETVGTNVYSTIWIKYVTGSIPVAEVVTQRKAIEEFKSYWPAGDPTGQIEMTFDGLLSAETPYATLGYGNREGADGEFYVETLPVAVKDNKLTVDFTGKLRTPMTMLPSFGSLYSNVEIKISGVCDSYGNPVKADQPGNVGSFSFAPAYNFIERKNISAEFTPENGGSLNGVNEIEIWISDASPISFTGFNFAYSENGVKKNAVVEKSAAKLTEANGGEQTWTVSVPDEVKGKKGVTVTLEGIETLDGFDHSDDVMAVYDAFVITSCDPANGAKLEGLTQGETITITTNYASLYPNLYIMYEIVDLEAADEDHTIVKSQSWLNRQEDGSYEAEIWGNYKFVLGHRYRCEFTAWESETAKNYREAPLGESYVTWEGLTAPFRFSDVQFVSITPSSDDGYVLKQDDRTFTVTFDGLVNIPVSSAKINLGMGATSSFESVTPVDPTEHEGTLYSSVWTLAVSESFMLTLAAPLDFSFKAYDDQDLLVEGNFGEEENSRFYFSYKTFGQYHDFDVIFGDGSGILTSLDKIRVECAEGIDLSWQYPISAAVVYDIFRNEVARVSSFSKKESESFSDELNTWLELTLSETISAPGRYVVVFPENYFSIGTEFNAFNSEAKTVEFEITGREEVAMTVTPAPGKVESLGTITIVFDDIEEIAIGSGRPTICINGGSEQKINDADLDWDILNKAKLILPSNYTANGEYVITFPAGYFLNYTTNTPLPEIKLVYTIGEVVEQPLCTFSPAPGEVTSLEKIDITFAPGEWTSFGDGKAKMSINGGDFVNLPDGEFGEEFNELIQPLGKEYTDPGTYEIFFPEGYILLGEWGDTTVKDMTITYVIKDNGTVSINGIETVDDGKIYVYGLNGAVILIATDQAELKQLPKGAYIINGNKILVK